MLTTALQLVLILSQISPVHDLQLHFFKLNSNTCITDYHSNTVLVFRLSWLPYCNYNYNYMHYFKPVSSSVSVTISVAHYFRNTDVYKQLFSFVWKKPNWLKSSSQLLHNSKTLPQLLWSASRIHFSRSDFLSAQINADLIVLKKQRTLV